MKTKSISLLSISLLMLLVLLFPRDSMAQFEKGHKIIGGNFSLAFENYRHGDAFSRNTFFSINPTVGYFLSEKSMIGASTGLTYRYINWQNSGSGEHYWGGGGSIFYRRFFKVAENFHFFLEPQARYHNTTQPEWEQKDFSLSLSPGLAFTFTEKFWFEARFGSVGYNYSHSTYPNDTLTRHRLTGGLHSFSSFGLFYIIK